jgi:acyl CoA:acetate/3-ketoacid CoA transferase alpha subunit
VAPAWAVSSRRPAPEPSSREGKEIRIIDGRRQIFETPLRADLAIVRAQIADRFGNARFHRTARNFSPLMATAADGDGAGGGSLVENGTPSIPTMSTCRACS